MAEETFGDRLASLASSRGQLCVGIDPHPALLEAWGLPVNPAGVKRFSELCVEAFGDLVALVKPQVAFYEQFGARGFEVLEATIAGLRKAGALVVADAKRGDIGSTMAGYARAWLDDASPLVCDAVTVSPFLGTGSLDPVVQLAEETGRGIFVLAATSNPEARNFQDRCDSTGRTISQAVVDFCGEINARHQDLGNLGVVVGATLTNPPSIAQLRGPVLLPGVGAQGAGVADVMRIMGQQASWAYPNVSRAVLQEGPNVAALRAAVRQYSVQFARPQERAK